MSNDLKQRMNSIRQTVQISSAQKLIAASQIGRARQLLVESEPYHMRISHAIADVLLQCPEIASKYIEGGQTISGRRGLLILSASRGLAGGFNSNIIRLSKDSLTAKPAVYIIVLGNACRSQLLQEGFPVDADYDQPVDHPTMFMARELAEKMVDLFERGQVDSFDIIHTRYRSSIRMETVERRLFPLNPAIFEGLGEVTTQYRFDPSAEHVLAYMTMKYLKGYLYGCLINTWICELTSRIMAMDNAIRNGNDMLDELTLIYNRTRQAAITQEITEIVAGAAALEGKE